MCSGNKDSYYCEPTCDCSDCFKKCQKKRKVVCVDDHMGSHTGQCGFGDGCKCGQKYKSCAKPKKCDCNRDPHHNACHC